MEHLRMFAQAVRAYGRALNLARSRLGADHVFTKGIETSVAQATEVRVERTCLFVTSVSRWRNSSHLKH